MGLSDNFSSKKKQPPNIPRANTGSFPTVTKQVAGKSGHSIFQPQVDPTSLDPVSENLDGGAQLDSAAQIVARQTHSQIDMRELMFRRLAEAQAEEARVTSGPELTKLLGPADLGLTAEETPGGLIINGLYRLDTLLARGGMGQVVLAYHLERKVPIVVKLMLQEVNREDPAFVKFLKECVVTNRIRHPNVVKVLDYGILLDGLKPYLVMEFVEGESLRKIIREHGRINEFDAARIMQQTCEGLEVVHAKEIVHRDLKPENIMIRNGCWMNDSVKILDFGIAQLQKESELNKDSRVIGSLGYMSPERLCNGVVDTRTDIYSLGVIYYESLTGTPPFRGNTALETMAMHVKAQHVPPSRLIPLDNPKVDGIVAKALAKDPDKRYQTIAELKADIVSML